MLHLSYPHYAPEGNNNTNKRNKKLTFKNNAPFRFCISKVNNIFIENAEDLDIVM